jgi:hypothetical protein
VHSDTMLVSMQGSAVRDRTECVSVALNKKIAAFANTR